MRLNITDREQVHIDIAVDVWGIAAQVGMCNEECGELIVALNQFDRGRVTIDDVASEVADVILMMAQLRSLVGPERVDAALDAKMERFMERAGKAHEKKYRGEAKEDSEKENG